MEPSSSQNSLVTPIAIIAGFAMVALAIYLSGGLGGSGVPTLKGGTASSTQSAKATIRPVDGTDYVFGNPNAPIVIVEYSDYDCPFCQVFHESMSQIMNEYGASGKVAWVYRQFPIADLHANSPKISEAALCAGELAGNDGFWKFSDAVFAGREVNQPTNMTRLSEYAATAGVDSKAFTKCLDSGVKKPAVDAAVAEAMAMGIEGTPHSILLVGNQQAVIEGAQPYAAVRQIIDSLVSQLDGTTPEMPVATSTTP